MSYHNTDIAACGHATCPSRESCLRWVIGQRMDDYQSFGSFQPRGGKCKFYRWTSERADDAVLSNLANTGMTDLDNAIDAGGCSKIRVKVEVEPIKDNEHG